MRETTALDADDKDWTWVLQRVCPECHVDVRTFPIGEVGGLIRANARAFAGELDEHAATATRRSSPDRWSLLEYGCHVRDVYELYLSRLDLMLTEKNPQYPNWDQDITAVEENYGGQDPLIVADQIVGSADALADRFDAVAGEQWQRTGRRSDGASFTVETFARYLLHDPEHHLWDVRSS